MREPAAPCGIMLSALSCRIGRRYLLREINWQVKDGEHWVVYGANGSGKTTLLSIIAGFQHHTNGQVAIGGEVVNGANALAMRRRVGFVSSAFFDKHYTKEAVLDIVLSGKSGTLSVSEDVTLADIRRAKDLLCALNLGDKMYRGFDLLSKGERQNVLIARALLGRPDILLLDEPCSGLDVYNRAHLFQTLQALAAEKVLTMIYVTHYIEEIDTSVFDKALLLRRGRVLAQGELAQVMTAENLSALLDYPVALDRDPDGKMRLRVEMPAQVDRCLLE